MNYLKGNDPALFVTDIANYHALRYRELYKGIELKYYAQDNKLKYDYIVQAGADIHLIKMQYKEVKDLQVNAAGELEITTDWGILKESMPYSYQEINGKRKEVQIAYKEFPDNTIGFVARGNYDKKIPLIIDPVIPTFVTFINGGNMADEGYINDIEVDAAGNIFMVGTVNMSMPGTMIGGTRFDNDIYVAKLSADGSTLLYASIMGATGDATHDVGTGIDINAAGEAFITGFTSGNNYPVTAGAAQTTSAGGSEMIYTRLNATGSALVYSTFMGGTNDDRGFDIEINTANEVFIVGTTYSTGLATAGVYQTAYSGMSDGFVMKYSAAGAKLWFTYYGGTNDDLPKGICLNAANNSFISGSTMSTTNIASAGAFSTSYNGGLTDGFVAKINNNGQRVYGTYLGGAGSEWLGAIRVNSLDQAIVIGASDAGNYPILNAYQTTLQGGPDAVMTAFNSNGASLLFSTYIGGNQADGWGKGTTMEQQQYHRPGGLDISDNVAMAIFVTSSTNYALINPIQINPIANIHKTAASYTGAYTGGADGTNWDSYIIAFDYRPANANQGIAALHATYLGESQARDYPTGGIKLLKTADTCYVVSVNSHCQNFPTTSGVYQPNGLPTTSGTVTNDQPTVSRFCIPPIPLPVEMIYFGATVLEDHSTLIEWKTATETNNFYFILEKSTDGENFNYLGKIEGHGTSGQSNAYSFTDSNFNTEAHYRIRQVDLDGSATYSTIAHAESNENEFTVAPNPVRNELNVTTLLDSDKTVVFSLYNQWGQIVYTNSIPAVRGRMDTSLPVEFLSAGMYTVQIITGNTVWTKKIIKE